MVAFPCPLKLVLTAATNPRATPRIAHVVP
jgi:hypothetical protein